MSGGSKSRTSSTTYNTTNSVSAQLSDEAQLAQNGATARDMGTALNVRGKGNNITVTDNGAVAMALDAVNQAGERSASSQGSVLNATRNILSDQVEAVKGLAESLKLGDEKTAKLITMAIIAGLVLVAIFFIWKG
ncbi:MAG TPA: hypothetical protein EYG20_02765 [Alcanivorax sp.]|nr:hypothetical protein [Alcanivorax sp.]